MTDSLSKKLNFSVNNYPIVLGTALNASELHSHGIDKVGFFARLILRPEKGEVLYLSKNSILTYLSGDDCTIKPVIDQKDKKKTMFGTIAYLWYKNDRLSKLGFQVIQNASFKADTLFEELEKRITATIAPPANSSKTQKVWNIKDQKLILTLPMNIQYGFIHLMFKE
ncbi:MAG: hypothetical protein AB1427_03630 [Thermodesulfobacteriota bacterium]